MQSKYKKVIKIIYRVTDILLCAALLSTASYCFYLYFGYKNAPKVCDAYAIIDEDGFGALPLDKQNNYYIPSDEELRLLVISDLQLGGASRSAERDGEALAALYALLSEKKPDITVINGAAGNTSFEDNGWLDNLSGNKLLFTFMKKLNCPWAVALPTYEYDFYNEWAEISPSSLYYFGYPTALYNRFMSKTFGETTNTSITLCSTNRSMRMCLAVLDFSQLTPDTLDASANEIWLEDWLTYISSSTSGTPYGKSAAECVKYVISPQELKVSEDVTLILPEEAKDGEYFSYSEITINPVQAQQTEAQQTEAPPQ